MENIVEPNDQFDFSKLTLTHPVTIQGGAYFTKLLNNHKSFYVQTLKSLTRQGVVKNGKKYSCELMFDNHSAELIHWFERLEETCQKLIFEKNDAWFQKSLEKNDVETAFMSVIRIYKSGKFYLVRTNIKTVNDEPMIKIYNENKLPINITEVTNDTKVVTLLEIQGIKFTTRSFQIEIEMKQMMILNDDEIFDSCLIKTQPIKKKVGKSVAINSKNEIIPTNPVSASALLNETLSNASLSNYFLSNENNSSNPNEHLDMDEMKEDEMKEDEMKNELEEINDLNIENLETVTLKQPNQVYFELYKKAREKAKAAKKEAILSFLEAKHIKETYMIDLFNENDIDSEIDAEIDAVSENELDNL